VTAVTSPPVLTDLTGKQRCSPRSGNCASYQGKADNGKSRPPPSSTSGATGSSASPDPRPRPQLRPRRRSPPRPTPTSALGEGLRLARPWASASASASEESPPRPTSASYQLRYWGSIITLPLASRLRLRRNKTGVPSKLLR
jgi:hypothetical protein